MRLFTGPIPLPSPTRTQPCSIFLGKDFLSVFLREWQILFTKEKKKLVSLPQNDNIVEHAYKHSTLHYSALSYYVSLQRAADSEYINDSCLPWQNIMYTNHMEPGYKSTLNAFVQLIVWLNLIFHWVTDLFIVGNAQRKMYGRHPVNQWRAFWLLSNVLLKLYLCIILPVLLLLAADELKCGSVSLHTCMCACACVCVEEGTPLVQSSSFMLLFIGIKQ